MKRRNRISTQAGFTLIELLLVVVIIGILAAIVVPNIIGGADDARLESARTQVKEFSNAMERYKMHCKTYPSTEEGLAALLAMLNSCAPGVAVVNIDNGFGAGFLAAKIIKGAHPEAVPSPSPQSENGRKMETGSNQQAGSPN